MPATRSGATSSSTSAGARPVSVSLKSLKGGIDNLGDPLGEARAFQLQGAMGRGTFAASGKLRLSPLGANLQLDAKRLDVARFEPYISVPLNVTIGGARLTSHAKLHYDERGDTPRLRYRGNAALERVRVQDKLTGDDFLPLLTKFEQLGYSPCYSYQKQYGPTTIFWINLSRRAGSCGRLE